MLIDLDQLASYQGAGAGRVALRREQREQLERNYHENLATGRRGQTSHRCHKCNPQKRRNGDKPVGCSG
jgi:hypothetical protein